VVLAHLAAVEHRVERGHLVHADLRHVQHLQTRCNNVMLYNMLQRRFDELNVV
jgi:hypothetical protein